MLESERCCYRLFGYDVDCIIRDFDFLLRPGTNSLLVVLCCSIYVSFFAMIGIKKMLMFVVSLRLSAIFLSYS